MRVIGLTRVEFENIGWLLFTSVVLAASRYICRRLPTGIPMFMLDLTSNDNTIVGSLRAQIPALA